MSKFYNVDCFSCEHSHQGSCKGCNTILNGENEPYENWELRQDLQERDNKIAQLKAQLLERRNTKAIECLEILKDKFCKSTLSWQIALNDYIYQQIKELKGE